MQDFGPSGILVYHGGHNTLVGEFKLTKQRMSLFVHIGAAMDPFGP